jgi:hypothetical protein
MAVKVQSSAINSVEFHSVSDNLTTFDVTFNTGQTYRYFGVPETIFSQFMSADSKGGYFHDNIRDRYKFNKL